MLSLCVLDEERQHDIMVSLNNCMYLAHLGTVKLFRINIIKNTFAKLLALKM